MKQYKITYKPTTGEGDDCYLSPDDPLHAMKDQMFLGRIPNVEVYEVYPEEDGYDRPRNPYSNH